VISEKQLLAFGMESRMDIMASFIEGLHSIELEKCYAVTFLGNTDETKISGR
jgi:hypothetical protein